MKLKEAAVKVKASKKSKGGGEMPKCKICGWEYDKGIEEGLFYWCDGDYICYHCVEDIPVEQLISEHLDYLKKNNLKSKISPYDWLNLIYADS